jgi:conjugative transposon TraN protein
MKTMQFYLNKLSLILTCVVLALLILRVEAQPVEESTPLAITFNKTTSIIFPTVIKSVDRGSRDVLAQKAKGVENVLQLKAAREEFPETNLTVITADGTIHQFTIKYAKEPARLVMTLNGNTEDHPMPLIFESQLTESAIENCAKRIVDTKRSLRQIRDANNKIHLALNGIYIKENVIFYRFEIKNASNINYDVDFLRFYIHDKAKVKRTASQEVEVKPVYVSGNINTIKGHTATTAVYALEKFTIPDAKRLVIEMFEKNGGRNVKLQIKNKTIVNARLIE